MNFATLKGLTIPEGVVTQIADESGRVLWSAVKSFADSTWEEIIAACQSRTVPDNWAVGDQKTLTANGKDYLINIIGKNHDNYADGTGKAPLTFQFDHRFDGKYGMTAAETDYSGWKNSQMRITHLPSILTLFPDNVQSAIKNVNKLTSAGNRSTEIETTSDSLFLLSEIEVFGAAKFSVDGEGVQYEYYSMGGSKIKSDSGAFSSWWFRSPMKNRSDSFCCCSNDFENGYGGTVKMGVVPAFCF